MLKKLSFIYIFSFESRLYIGDIQLIMAGFYRKLLYYVFQLYILDLPVLYS